MHLGQDMYLEEVCWISLLFGGSLWAIFIRGYVFPGPFCSASVIPRIPNNVGARAVGRAMFYTGALQAAVAVCGFMARLY